ncbi:hypothetical protein Fmac_026645 [Flemingia macrophylla]|uniref:Non-structural maintenance of chromosomes element 1 homolog n=1 Tax=Flemingia macrophylla TaxID=520843 RepID=A0ABD1LFM1_9FABA
MSTALSWRHHVVIQALLSRGPLNEKDLHSIFEDLTKKNPGTDRQLFDGFILKINKALSCANFELRACIDQYDGQVYYGVVNTVSDEHSKLGTKYTVPQIAFYKAIIEAIVQDASANGVVSSIRALNLSLDGQANENLKGRDLRRRAKMKAETRDGSGETCDGGGETCEGGGGSSIVEKRVTIVSDPQSQGSQPNVPSSLKNFSLTQKEKTLQELVRDQWLNLTTDGIIKLGLKSFLDLRSWFRNNDVPSCHVCNEAGIKAQLCKNENCSVRIHQYCLKQLFLQRKVANVCPSCGSSWPYTVPKEEAAQTEDDNEPVGSQQVTSSERKRHRAYRVVDDDVGCSNQDELNECRERQHGRGLVRKGGRTGRADDANLGGSGASQSSADISVSRRVTRNSARLI